MPTPTSSGNRNRHACGEEIVRSMVGNDQVERLSPIVVNDWDPGHNLALQPDSSLPSWP